jgi:hypothetical protein
MFRPRHALRAARRGIILLVVLALLTLFAVVGLSFVLYADGQATSARLFREAQSPSRPDVEPELLLAYFLGQLIFDVEDDETGVYSALRGHSLARLMYGYNDSASTSGQPFSGTGRLHAPSPFPGIDDYDLINYTYFPADGLLRDPERLGTRPTPAQGRGPFTGGFNAPYTYPDLNNMFLAAVKADGTVLLPSFFRPWPDPPNGFGPMGVRDATGNFLPNPNWFDNDPKKAYLKYLTLRPRPADNPGFPAPEDPGGDVKNLIGAPGGNDSIWLDLGAPVRTAPDGRKYKPLFAPLIVDLDNRVNVNVHGNVRGKDFQGQLAHLSNQGWGPWEVNLGKVLTKGNEWAQLSVGSGFPQTGQPPLLGRYGGMPWLGQVGTPGIPDSLAPAGRAPRFFGQVDLDGSNEGAGGVPTGRIRLPGFKAPPFSPFPGYPAGYGNGSPAERREHPLLYDFFNPQGDNRVFRLSNLEALLRHGDTGTGALTSELLGLCPQNFVNPSDPAGSARRRRLVTTHSFDFDKPGVTPWVYNVVPNPNIPPQYLNQYQVDPAKPTQPPSGPPLAFPPVAWRLAPPPGFNGPPPFSEFAPDWRARFPGYSWWWGGGSGRIGLNRPLPPFPHHGSGLAPPFGPPLLKDPNGRFDDGGPIQAQFQAALTARQQLADDIYRQLLAVTGVPPPVKPAAPKPEELAPRRWLAQLAVNIVDYIDEDDISTPFNFYTEADAYPYGPPPPGEPFDIGAVSQPDSDGNGHLQPGEIQWPMYWVFGTELPHVVVNEVLAETFDASVTANYPPPGEKVRVFVELHNPFPGSVSPTVQPADRLPVPLKVPALPNGGPSPSGDPAGAYTPYRVVLAVQQPPGLIAPGASNDNVLGNPDQVRAATNDADFTNPVGTVSGGPQPPGPGPTPSPYIPAQPQGFFLLGPPAVGGPDPQGFGPRDPFQPPNTDAIPPKTPLLRTATLEYQQPFQANATDDERTTGVSVLLRRLANPHLPFNPQRSVPVKDPNGNVIRYDPNPWYNPYMTLDYLEGIPLRQTKDGNVVFSSRGKRQPYAADLSQVADQQAKPTPNKISATFGSRNLPPPNLANAHYDWLVHLDRQLISPMELLHVSGYQPYQLTHQFIRKDNMFNHRVPWFDQSNRLYRVFEFLEAHNHAEVVLARNGRLPGMINLNTVWDAETFQALCDAKDPTDPQNPNYFNSDDIQAIFKRMIAQRTPGLLTGGGPGPTDRPFRSLASGYILPGDTQYPPGSGIEDTLLRSWSGGERRLFQPTIPPSVPSDAPARHPYVRDQLLTKIFNQVTTRSNVFAVWVTVGFFEVTDDTTRPVKLGAEVGRAQNRHIRHRMFAIVDRSTLGFNPGPQERFDPHADAALVPHFSIID